MLREMTSRIVEATTLYIQSDQLAKIREKVYEVVGICYLDDYNDNYIENSIMLFD